MINPNAISIRRTNINTAAKVNFSPFVFMEVMALNKLNHYPNYIYHFYTHNLQYSFYDIIPDKNNSL